MTATVRPITCPSIVRYALQDASLQLNFFLYISDFFCLHTYSPIRHFWMVRRKRRGMQKHTDHNVERRRESDDTHGMGTWCGMAFLTTTFGLRSSRYRHLCTREVGKKQRQCLLFRPESQIWSSRLREGHGTGFEASSRLRFRQALHDQKENREASSNAPCVLQQR